MTKIHVIADEKLGGVQREFIKVDRKAEVGDKVIVTACNYTDEDEIYTVGDIGLIVENDKGYIRADFTEQGNKHVYGNGLWYVGHTVRNKYAVLESTDVVIIDGPDGQPSRHRLVERKAEVGDKVIVVNVDDLNSEGYSAGHIDVATERWNNDHNNATGIDGETGITYFDTEYRVLEPVEPTVEATADNPDSMLDLMANLARRLTALEQQEARRVTSLEQQLRSTQDNVEMLGRELEVVKGAEKEASARELASKIIRLIREGGYGKCE
jgi:aspartate 1-decarboxylase